MTDKKHKKLAHLFDATQCVGCSACILACTQTNYPEMLNGEVSGWNWLPSNIRKITVERARRRCRSSCSASSARMRPA